MRKIIGMTILIAGVSTAAFAADKTWTGKISDSMCGAKHGMGTMSERDCTEACIKKGANYVFVEGNKVYKLADANNVIAAHAGHTVQLTGTMKGDTITVTKVAMPPAASKKK